MLKKLFISFIIVMGMFHISACSTSFQVGDKVIGIESGKLFYTDGYLRTNYHTSFDHTWKACEQTLADIKATNVTVVKKIAHGSFEAMLNEDKLRIAVEYVESDITEVAVRIGVAGNNYASQTIHSKIKNNLLQILKTD